MNVFIGNVIGCTVKTDMCTLVPFSLKSDHLSLHSFTVLFSKITDRIVILIKTLVTPRNVHFCTLYILSLTWLLGVLAFSPS